MYTITLANGTVLNNLTLNGNNFIAPGIIDNSTFENNLNHVVITNNETGISETHEDMFLVQNTSYGDGHSWFVLEEKSEYQKAMERIENLLTSNTNSITDVQIALTEIYEMMLGGKS